MHVLHKEKFCPEQMRIKTGFLARKFGLKWVMMVHARAVVLPGGAGPALHSCALLAGQTDGRGDWGAAWRGLSESLLGSGDSFQSPPASLLASSPSPGHCGTAWLRSFETPSDLERGEKPFSVSVLAWKRDDLRRWSSAQPPAAFVSRTLCSSPCRASHLTARRNGDQRCRPSPAWPNPPQNLSAVGKYVGK